jgi:hypothetical protein
MHGGGMHDHDMGDGGEHDGDMHDDGSVDDQSGTGMVPVAPVASPVVADPGFTG